MKIVLSVIDGPHRGAEFAFEEHDSFVVGRHRTTQFRLSLKDLHLSRRHFLIEVNPPRCLLMDLDSTNRTRVNGRPVTQAILNDGDTIRAGKTTIRASIVADAPAATPPPRIVAAEGVPRFPHYRVERLLGQGTAGVVYQATDERDGSAVALKLISPVIADCPKASAIFEREAAILSRLDHPHIVGLREFGRAEGRLYLAMEYVAGRDAYRLVAEHDDPLPIGRAVGLARQTLSALAHAHTRGIVHRDIKPPNLLVADLDGRDLLKVADFGLARIYRDSSLSGLTLDGDVRGTLGFLAPEQILNLRDVGPLTDQYSLAGTLYYLLTGRKPYDFPEGVEKCFVIILEQDPVPIRQRRPEVPEGLAAVIRRALDRDPSARFPDAEALRRALAPWSDEAIPGTVARRI